MVYVSRYLAKNKDKIIILKETIFQLWLPVAIILGLILPANFSTTAIVFVMAMLLAFIGGYPLKSIVRSSAFGIFQRAPFAEKQKRALCFQLK